jgi:hypothetical protein
MRGGRTGGRGREEEKVRWGLEGSWWRPLINGRREEEEEGVSRWGREGERSSDLDARRRPSLPSLLFS